VRQAARGVNFLMLWRGMKHDPSWDVASGRPVTLLADQRAVLELASRTTRDALARLKTVG
jgi:hypothetical protein